MRILISPQILRAKDLCGQAGLRDRIFPDDNRPSNSAINSANPPVRKYHEIIPAEVFSMQPTRPGPFHIARQSAERSSSDGCCARRVQIRAVGSLSCFNHDAITTHFLSSRSDLSVAEVQNTDKAFRLSHTSVKRWNAFHFDESCTPHRDRTCPQLQLLTCRN